MHSFILLCDLPSRGHAQSPQHAIVLCRTKTLLHVHAYRGAPPHPDLTGGARARTHTHTHTYGISMGLVSGSQSAAQREADRVFGPKTVTVTRCQHLRHSGLVNPVFDLDITGVPPGWDGCTAPASDSRMPVRRWHRCLRKSTGPLYTPVGKKSVLPAVQGCAVPEDEEMEDSPPGATATEEDDSIL